MFRSKHRHHRMEFYTAMALLVGVLSFSHALGYWPHGLPLPTTEHAAAGGGAVDDAGGDLEGYLRCLFARRRSPILFGPQGWICSANSTDRGLPEPRSANPTVRVSRPLRRRRGNRRI